MRLMWLAVLSLQGCASVFDAPEEQFEWFRERPASAVPYAVAYVDPGRVGAVCRGFGGDGTERGCTSHSRRLIVLPIGAPDWYLRHERRHEAGWNHY